MKASEDADLGQIRTEIDSILADYPTVTVQTQEELKEQIEDQAAALLAILIALLGLAIFIAVLGIINTLVAVGPGAHPRDRHVARRRNLTSPSARHDHA